MSVLLQVAPETGEALIILITIYLLSMGTFRVGSNVSWLAYGIAIMATMLAMVGVIELSVLWVLYGVIGLVVAMTNIINTAYGS